MFVLVKQFLFPFDFCLFSHCIIVVRVPNLLSGGSEFKYYTLLLTGFVLGCLKFNSLVNSQLVWVLIVGIFKHLHSFLIYYLKYLFLSLNSAWRLAISTI